MNNPFQNIEQDRLFKFAITSLDSVAVLSAIIDAGLSIDYETDNRFTEISGNILDFSLYKGHISAMIHIIDQTKRSFTLKPQSFESLINRIDAHNTTTSDNTYDSLIEYLIKKGLILDSKTIKQLIKCVQSEKSMYHVLEVINFLISRNVTNFYDLSEDDKVIFGLKFY